MKEVNAALVCLLIVTLWVCVFAVGAHPRLWQYTYQAIRTVILILPCYKSDSIKPSH